MINRGMFKIMVDRTRWYVSIVQFSMIGYLFIIQTEFNMFAVLILMLISFPIVAILDWKLLISQEVGQLSRKNPILMEMLDGINKIEERQDKYPYWYPWDWPLDLREQSKEAKNG